MDLRRLQQLAGIEERKQTPEQLKHCVADVAPKHDGDTSRAFAICTASLQKAGQIKKGSQDLTSKGSKVARQKADEPDATTKKAEYEKLLAASRKEEAKDMTAKHDEATCPHCQDAATLSQAEYRKKHSILGDFAAVRAKGAKGAGSNCAQKISERPDVHAHMSKKHGEGWFEKWKAARVHEPLVAEAVEWHYTHYEDSPELEVTECISETTGVPSELDEEIAMLEYEVEGLEMLSQLMEVAREQKGSLRYHKRLAVSSARNAFTAMKQPGSNDSRVNRKQRLHGRAAFHYHALAAAHHAASEKAKTPEEKKFHINRSKASQRLAHRHDQYSGGYYIPRDPGEWRHTDDHAKEKPTEFHPGHVQTPEPSAPTPTPKRRANPYGQKGPSPIQAKAESVNAVEEYKRMAGLVDLTEGWLKK